MNRLFLCALFLAAGNLAAQEASPTATPGGGGPVTASSLPGGPGQPQAGGFYLQAGGGYSAGVGVRRGFNAALGGGMQVTREVSLLTSFEATSLALPASYDLYYDPFLYSGNFLDLSLSESVQYEFFPGNPCGLYLLAGVGVDYIPYPTLYSIDSPNNTQFYFSFQGGIGTELRLQRDLWLYAEERLHAAGTVAEAAGDYFSILNTQAGLKLAFDNGPAAPQAASPPGPAAPGINPYMEGNRFFVKTSGVLGSLLGGDLEEGINAFNALYPNDPYYVNGEGGGSNYSWANFILLQHALEVGYALDPYDGISLGLTGGQAADIRLEYETFSNGGNEIDQDLSLWIEEFGVNYYRYLPDRDGRWYATLGAAYLAASMSYDYDSDTLFVGSDGPLTGSGWLASLGVGRESLIWEDIGLDANVKVMTGNIPSLQGNYTSSTGYNNSTSGKGELVLYPNHLIGLVDLNGIAAANARALAVDMTGIEAGLSVVLYY